MKWQESAKGTMLRATGDPLEPILWLLSLHTSDHDSHIIIYMHKDIILKAHYICMSDKQLDNDS